ncbi:unnamed protein product [Lactuca virosa]|uniref:BHLH domain-containing protein n=1 Tax=Lactuca virosa TaxID=75947 RepID=A0AAU9MTT8_9ASTR|nr:unnamed protein product [Lactuca virosa]
MNKLPQNSHNRHRSRKRLHRFVFSIEEKTLTVNRGGDEDVMELLWQNGQVVMQSRNQRSVGNKKPETRLPVGSRDIRSSVVEEETGPSDLFMQEDEMASWLHYPVDDNTLEGYLYSNDLLYPTPPSSTPVTTPCSLPPPPPPSIMIPSPRPPVAPIRRVELESGQPKYPNFLHFSRHNKLRTPESGNSSSNETPAVAAPESRASRVSDKPTPVSAANIGRSAAGTSSAGREIETCERSVSPGSGGSGASGSVEPSSQKPPPPTTDDHRKRKGRDTYETECHSEDVEFGCLDAKKQSQGSTSTKRSRAAEVHNLSERRRRDRINEKMKALQELIPRSNKSDKASMLDEAIEYLKSLQMQVQMMSMGCNMVPMMFPGVQQYMPPMAMGMGMGMSMSMDMGMNHVMVPYPAILPGSSVVPSPGTHMGPRFPVSGFNIHPVNATCPATSQATNLSAPIMSSFPLHNQNQPQVPNFADPFQQYIGLRHQTPSPLPQNHEGMASTATKPSSSKDPIDPDHHQNG